MTINLTVLYDMSLLRSGYQTHAVHVARPRSNTPLTVQVVLIDV